MLVQAPFGGYPYGKYRTLAQLAGRGYVAAHHARKLARDGKSQAGSSVIFGDGAVGLDEFVKQLRHLLRTYSNTGVGDGEFIPLAPVHSSLDAQLDFAILREFAGIAEQVEKNLPQPH